MTYTPPLTHMMTALRLFAQSDKYADLPQYEDASADLVIQILEEAGKLAQDELAPLNNVGDQNPAILTAEGVKTSPGFKQAYGQYQEAGWNALSFEAEYGGQALPLSLTLAVNELWQTANMSFGLCPMLNNGAVEALQAHASDRIKQVFLPNMISGAWTGTMNLTESQAGSDLAAVKTKAEPVTDGVQEDHIGQRYKIFGQKIFITYGDHDFTDNIIHLVLARLPDAPAGVKGISLFVVPKYMVGEDGNPADKNDVACVSLEHKLGIHGSPTCVMGFGEESGAIGYLVGEPHKGLAYMFTMMNNARLGVALQGVAIGERAYQHALSYANERVQGRIAGQDAPAKAPIIYHADIRRMLVSMRARVASSRAICYLTAGQQDIAAAHPDQDQRQAAQMRVDVLIPIAKAFVTDMGVDVASDAVQVFGGMGYIEETGAAQYYRDARIAPIYEGTNGIQAIDLLGRKMVRDQGAGMTALLDFLKQDVPEADFLPQVQQILQQGFQQIEASMQYLLSHFKEKEAACWAGAVPFLKLWGDVLSLWTLIKLAKNAPEAQQALQGHMALTYALLYTQPACALGLAIQQNLGESIMAITPEDLSQHV